MKNIITRTAMLEVLQKIRKDPAFYNRDEEYLVRMFLSHFTDCDAFSVTIGQLTQIFHDRVHKAVSTKRSPGHIYVDLLPILEPEFIKQILKIYLKLECAPVNFIKDIYIEATAILRDIEDRVKKFNAEILAINSNSDKAQDGESRKLLLEHFIKKNRIAKEAVIDFLCNHVNAEALYRARDKEFDLANLYGTNTLADRWRPEDYDVEYITRFENKFGYDHDLVEILEINELASTKPEEYRQFLSRYIFEQSIVKKIENMLISNHRLNKRREVLHEALSAYSAGHYRLFSSILPIQIEGIFYDYCLEIGLNESALQKRYGLVQKLELISEYHEGFFFCFEYYSFLFPQLRNKVAHGGQLSGDVEVLANELLLDLRDICTRMNSDDLPMNLAVKIAKELESGKSDWRILFKFAMVKKLLLSSAEILEFYKIPLSQEKFVVALESKEFINIICTTAEQNNPTIISGLYKLRNLISNADSKRALTNAIGDFKPVGTGPPLSRLLAAIDSAPEPTVSLGEH